MDRFATVEEKQIFGYIVKQPYLGWIIYPNIYEYNLSDKEAWNICLTFLND